MKSSLNYDFLLNKNVFLTGATGLIGGQLALAIAQSAPTIFCLVRKKNDARAEMRLSSRLLQSSRSVPPVIAKPGDLTKPHLGLSEIDYTELINSVDIIIHCAAETSFLQEESCEETNIKGTQKMIEFAHQCKKNPLFIYISTACNVGQTSNIHLSEEEGCRPQNDHYNAYTQTKAHSEKMVLESGLKTFIIRPSIVLSNGIRNRSFARQILWFAPLMQEFDALPLREDAQLDIVPVSFLTHSFLQILLDPKRRHSVYHVSAGKQSAQVKEWVQMIDRYYMRKTPLKMIQPEEWGPKEYKYFIKTPIQRKIFFALKFYFPFINMNVTFDHSRLQEVPGDFTVPHPSSYLTELLTQIHPSEALAESLTP